MTVRLHPHAVERLQEREATREEVVSTVLQGEQIPAKFGRSGFRRNFTFNREWRGRRYSTKQILVYAIRDGEDWLVITVITRFF